MGKHTARVSIGIYLWMWETERKVRAYGTVITERSVPGDEYVTRSTFTSVVRKFAISLVSPSLSLIFHNEQILIVIRKISEIMTKRITK